MRLAGINGAVPLADARDIAEILAWRGQMPAASRWVESVKQKVREERSKHLPHNML